MASYYTVKRKSTNKYLTDVMRLYFPRWQKARMATEEGEKERCLSSYFSSDLGSDRMKVMSEKSGKAALTKLRNHFAAIPQEALDLVLVRLEIKEAEELDYVGSGDALLCP